MELSYPMIIIYALIFLMLYITKELLTQKSGFIKYYLPFIMSVIAVSFFSIINLPIYALDAKNVRNAKKASKFIKVLTKLFRLQWILRGEPIIAEERGCVVVANHQSILDILGMMNIWEVMDKCTTIAKRSLLYWGPFGLGAYLAGTVMIDRNDPQSTYQQLHITSELMVKQKTKIWFFPEGTRNTIKKGILPFKKGAFRIAINSQVPIIPVVYSPYYFLNKEKHFIGKGRVIITCLEPIKTEGLTLDDIDFLIMKTRSVMLECYDNVFKEVMSDLPADYPLPSHLKFEDK